MNPEVSVVMAVWNSGAFLEKTIDSVLNQEGVNLEFIVVDDGSTDDTPNLLADLAARDSRLRVLRQEHAGLTAALRLGCSHARGKFIARQDAGDVSLPGRLSVQKAILGGSPSVSMVSCGTRMLGPGGEELFETNPPAGNASEALLRFDLANIQGPSHHGSVMFSRLEYERVGGYRTDFYFAQDLDLWIRLVEGGLQHFVLGKVMYEATLSQGCISALMRAEQVETARLILEAARCRSQGKSEADILRRAGAIRPVRRSLSRIRRARASYFVSMCLRQRNDRRYVNYLKYTLRLNPLLARGWIQLIRGMFMR